MLSVSLAKDNCPTVREGARERERGRGRERERGSEGRERGRDRWY